MLFKTVAESKNIQNVWPVAGSGDVPVIRAGGKVNMEGKTPEKRDETYIL